MEKPPHRVENQESKEVIKNPNRIFEWGMMPKNSDVLTTSENVYRSVKIEAVADLRNSGVVRNAGSGGVGRVRKYGDRVYWTRGKEGQFHIVQPDHVVLEAPFEIAQSRIVTLQDMVSIHERNESGVIENRISNISQSQAEMSQTLQRTKQESEKLSEIRSRLGLFPTK